MLRDRVVLITGGSRGLGKALVKAFAAEGARVVIAARNPETLEAARREIAESGGTVLALAADMTQPADISRVVDSAIERFGRIDVLINNGGTLGPTPRPALLDTDSDAMLETFRVNTVGPLRVTQAVLPHMLEQGRGLVINVTSDASRGAYPEWGAYGASKAALELIGLTWAAELEGTGVRVVNVDPGDLQTDMQQAAFPGEDISDRALPESAAPAFVWLASEAGWHVNGERVQAQEFKQEATGSARVS
jgi:NAD(P)-dependent dehydrogenase (short-subunit alcohol dehydrogenase family)